MIITRTPFRVSFFGGGTDYPVWYNSMGGAVLSTSINKYCYITTRPLPPFFDYAYRIRYTLREETNSIDDIGHPSVRECLKHAGLRQGIEMVHTSDLPAMSGLGSSSAFTVGFLNSLYGLAGRRIGKRKLALEAIRIEQEKIGENVGSQDQVAAAIGGLNWITFSRKKISVSPLKISGQRQKALEGRLLMFFTGFSRRASTIAAEQIKNTPKKEKELRAMLTLAHQAKDALISNRNLDEFGELLHESWCIKKTLSSKITTPFIDEFYEKARSAGAIGGKLLGAGGGGFMVFYAPEPKHQAIRQKLKGYLHVPFSFENKGSQVIYRNTAL